MRGPGTPSWPPTVALVGPTASGKSAAALAVAEASPPPVGGEAAVELVSVDSMAVYRGMDIGTAKPDAATRARVPVHLVDLVDPHEEFTVRQFQEAAEASLAGIRARGGGAVLVGGTGLYLRALVDGLTFPGRFPAEAAALEEELDAAGPPGSPGEEAARIRLHDRLTGLDPVAAGRIHPANRRRLVRALEVTLGSGRPFSSFGPGLERYPEARCPLVGLRVDAGELDRRIESRFAAQLEAGWLDEVRRLAARPGGLSRTARQALGYRELLAHVEGGVPLADAVDEALRRTRAFARRQMAWFRRDPRIVWVDDPVAHVRSLLGGPSR